jgi:hypothetical protein
LTAKFFDGPGRVPVSAALRRELVDAYDRQGWASSRHAAAAARSLGFHMSHQTIENFRQGKTSRTDRATLRAWIAIHGLDAERLARFLDLPPELDPWTVTLPEDFWRLPHSRRAEVYDGLVKIVGATFDIDKRQ